MNPEKRTLLQVTVPDALPDMDNPVDELVDQLMGKQAEARFNFIQANATYVDELDI